MEKFILKPNIDRYLGIRVTKDTTINFSNDNVKQTLKNLKFHSETKIVNKDYKSRYITDINLNEGDILIFEEESRGYIKPAQEMYTIDEAIEELNDIKE